VPASCSTSAPCVLESAVTGMQVDDKAVQTPFEGNAHVHLTFPEVHHENFQL